MKYLKARLGSIFFVMLAIVTMAGPYEAFGGEKNVLNFGTGVDVTTLDPHNWKTARDLLAINLVYEGLLTLDPDLKVVPMLATSWERVDDTAWKFKLRKGVKFHDGTPFNAEAAKINLDRMRNAPRAKGVFGIIDSVTIEDEYSIVIKTKMPFAPFINNVCHPVGSMISPKAIERYGTEIGHHAVGTGKFVLKEWIPKEKIVLLKNENYWGEKPKLNQVLLRPIPEEGTRTMAFESGEIDIVTDPAPHRITNFKKNKDIQVIAEPAARVVWLGYNTQDKVLSNVKLRLAIAQAINRVELVDYVAEGLAINASAWIPAIVKNSKKKYAYDYDPKKAKDLLKEAGYPNGLELNLWSPEGRYLKDKQIAEAIQAQLSAIGIRIKLSVKEWGSYVDALFRKEQQLFIWGWAFQVGDPDAMLRENFFSKSSYNCTAYNNPEYDKLLDKAVSTMDTTTRAALYDDIQQMLIDDVVGCPIYHSQNIFAIWKKVKGFKAHPLELVVLDKTVVE
ncbi:MAG: ABC transporter substrate-binding protein [Thermodesulfobacteriota bacterium]